MKIKQLTLSGYKRLMLNNIRHLVLDFQSIYQLILGTNGSGKSSVLYELSPLPAQSNNYVKGGYKEIFIEDRGHKYELRSVFKSGNKHSFVKDGEELNPGGTGAVQKELVEQEFRITQELHELLIGETHFTNLSPAKRREWMTRLCHVDFTYALGVHQKLKSASRDAQGALKHTKNRLTQENNKLLAVGDLEALESRYQTLHNELNVLFTERNPNALDVTRGEKELVQTLSDLESLSTLLLEKTPELPAGYTFYSLQDIDAKINELTTEFQVSESLRNRIGTEQDELQHLLEGFKEAGVESLDALHRQIIELKQERYQTLRAVEVWRELTTDPMETQRSYFEASQTLMEVLNGLPENKDRRFSKQKVREAKEKLPQVEQKLGKYRNQLAHYESQLEHLLSLKKEECPECGYRWVPGRSDRDKALLEQTIQKGKISVEKLDVQRTELQEYLESADEYKQSFYAFRQLTHQYPRLRDLWDALLNDERLYSAPHELATTVHLFGKDLDLHCKVQNASERLEKLEKLLESPTEGGQMKGVLGRLEALSGQVQEVTLKLDELKREIDHLNRYRKHVKVYLEKSEQLEEQFARLEELRDALVEGYRNHHINTVIRDHQEQLAGLQAKRTEKQTLEGIILDLEKDERELGKNHDVLKLLASELSPVDGLIAEQLTGFIESFVGHVNQVIESIWTYELRVMPCGLESGDLDYKFPLYVKHEGENNQAPDISKGSEAQVEVVNLAFRLVTMVYLGLEEYPVYLDEAGRSFDEQHRTNLLSFIKQLVDAGNYTQLFIISHYAAQFNVFTNAEILVLDSTNVSVPKQHNLHATLE
tara:strand:+ start:595 stop:3066 length:2472 start_codon:yes stop_codon:yes gene_type:complete